MIHGAQFDAGVVIRLVDTMDRHVNVTARTSGLSHESVCHRRLPTREVLNAVSNADCDPRCAKTKQHEDDENSSDARGTSDRSCRWPVLTRAVGVFSDRAEMVHHGTYDHNHATHEVRKQPRQQTALQFGEVGV
jgi:hypothetical protein